MHIVFSWHALDSGILFFCFFVFSLDRRFKKEREGQFAPSLHKKGHRKFPTKNEPLSFHSISVASPIFRFHLFFFCCSYFVDPHLVLYI